MNNIKYYQDSIPVVFASNSNYLPYTSVLIQSIMENANKNKKYAFYLLYKDINIDSINLFEAQIASYSQFSIEFIDVNPYIQKYDLFISRHITTEAYFRLLIPALFFEYKKVIYLDCDMICCADISELMEFNLENHLLGAVCGVRLAIYYEMRKKRYNSKNNEVFLNLKNKNEYFNSGMCIFNIELFNETYPSSKLLELAASRDWNFHDQDVLNFIAEGKTFLLPYNWNYIPIEHKKYLQKSFQNEYYDAEKNPKIIHYKPWDCNNYITHFELFWKYATRTPFIDIIIKNMRDKELFSGSYTETIIANIKQNRLGLKFILIDCIKAWFCKNNKN